MPEQDLDGPDVGPGLQEVGGEAVPQGMNGDVLAQSRGLTSVPADLLHRVGMERLLRILTREEVSVRTGRLPILTRQERYSC